MNFYINHFSFQNLIWDILFLILNYYTIKYFFTRKNIFLNSKLDINYIKTYLFSIFVLFVFITIFSYIFRFSSFLKIRYLWTTLTVFIPAHLLILSFISKKKYVILVGTSFILLKFYSEVYEPNDLDVEKISIYSNKIKSKIKITHISDLQTDGIGQIHLDARDASNEFEPDLILFTGDVLNHIQIQKEVEEYLIGFWKKEKAYFVTGDVDSLLSIDEFTKNIHFQNLNNKSDILNIGKEKIGFIGLDLKSFQNKNLISNLQKEILDTDFQILFTHRPDVIFHLEPNQVDVVFAGHTHGGQVQIPFIGPIIKLSDVSRKIAKGGLNEHNSQKIILSRGLGMEGHVAPRIRFLCRPHILLIEIIPK